MLKTDFDSVFTFFRLFVLHWILRFFPLSDYDTKKLFFSLELIAKSLNGFNSKRTKCTQLSVKVDNLDKVFLG